MTRLMIIAGEASGDLHAGHVIAELNRINPDIEKYGTGGQLLEAAGVELYYRVEDLAVIGFKEVLKRYGYYKGIFDRMVALLDKRRPDAVFLVDYAGFNLRFAKEAKKRGIKVLFYIAPQVWAWKKNRIKTIRAYVDELIVLFPFEVEFFKKEGMACHCFGHPLLDIAKPSLDKETYRAQLDPSPPDRLIALLPGSRQNEVAKHLPLLLDVAERLQQIEPDLQFIYPLAPTIPRAQVEEQVALAKAGIHLVEGETYNAVAASDFALVASGTASLETAILQTPLLIFYKVTQTTWMIGRYLLGIKSVGLPNIVLGETLVPELIQADSNPAQMATEVIKIINNKQLMANQRRNLARLRQCLGETGAYPATAQFLNKQIPKNPNHP
ncbi:MAG: lipid-A-disaccharide synthase [Candidatus Lambdaproteobacteria bacterium RIFOXYD2_FULL_50_16]|uniref:Lipid-A-disaccharide synthase n=1 Tax=Candidatus Lambdaproteobacteria bacterium RIFOXYD2_FULL_50_16 TaxID=1817772 RepID=A0A1F6GFY0_9PROT|nr:MAG: lipid-A-disaccharide synthase [Candidatus Lambdaproteobacteria bacterium RIFOXYD2_FULL_50_16]